MKKLCSFLLFLTLTTCFAFADQYSTLRGKTLEQTIDYWGLPSASVGNIKIWEIDTHHLIAGFTQKGTQFVVNDYIVMDADRKVVAGTIAPEETVRNIRRQISNGETILHSVYSYGSGPIIHAKISYDGYIVEWTNDCLGKRFSFDTALYDCCNRKYTTMFSYLIDRLFRK